MTIASRGHQHPVRHFPAIIQDRVPGKRSHPTIRFLHDQIRRGKIPVPRLPAGEGSVQIALRDPAKAERATGYVVGGISPLGQRKRLRAFLDAGALSLDEIVVNGGRRGLQIALKPQDLIRATSAAVSPLQA